MHYREMTVSWISLLLILNPRLSGGDRLRWGVYALKRVSNRATFTKLELVYLPQFRERFTVDGQCGFCEPTAALSPQSGTGLAEGKSGQAEHDWPLKVTGLRQQTGSFLPPAKQHHFPGCFSGHHFLGCSSQHHFSEASSAPCV